MDRRRSHPGHYGRLSDRGDIDYRFFSFVPALPFVMLAILRRLTGKWEVLHWHDERRVDRAAQGSPTVCGINGVFHYRDGVPDAHWSRASRARSATAVRTTRACGTGPAALGQRRLSIVDLSPAGHQPMPNEDESLWVTFNGELYNWPELRARARSRAATASAATPTPRRCSTCTRSGARTCSTTSARDVRVRAVRRGPAHAPPRARPARHQAAVLARRRPADRVRERAQGAAARSRRCHARSTHVALA